MIDISLGKLYLKLLTFDDTMFNIFPFDDVDHLERKWNGVCNKNPLLFISQLSEPQLEALILWAIKEVDSITAETLSAIIKFLKKRRSYHRWYRFKKIIMFKK